MVRESNVDKLASSGYVYDFRALAFGDLCLELALPVDPTVQTCWLLQSVSRAVHATQSLRECVRKWRERDKDIAEQHRALWPGVEVPNLIQLHSPGSRTGGLWAPTSVMLAGVVLFFQMTKRSRDMRQQTYLLLRHLCEVVCEAGIDLEVVHASMDGTFYQHVFRVEGSPLVDASDLWPGGER